MSIRDYFYLADGIHVWILCPCCESIVIVKTYEDDRIISSDFIDFSGGYYDDE